MCIRDRCSHGLLCFLLFFFKGNKLSQRAARFGTTTTTTESQQLSSQKEVRTITLFSFLQILKYFWEMKTIIKNVLISGKRWHFITMSFSLIYVNYADTTTLVSDNFKPF